MRLAILSVPPLNTSGWARYTRDLISALAARQHHITLITSTDAPADPELPLAGYERVLPPLIPPIRLTSPRLLAKQLQVHRLIANAEVVHVIAEPYTLAIPLTRRVVVTAHGTYVPLTAKRFGFGLLYRMAYRRAKVICVSHYTERIVQTALPGLDTTVITNGVHAARFEQPGTPPIKHGPTVLAVGQVKARKGYSVLAKAMRIVRESIPDAQAVFVGDTSDHAYGESLRAQIAAEGLTDSVQILGRVPEDVLMGWYHAADVFALPALNVGQQFEGFGLTYLEASAAGLPVIGTLDCGAEDAIREGQTGYLVPQNDPAALADALIRLLRDPALRQQMGVAGQQFAHEHTWDRIAERVEGVYRVL